MKLGIKVPHLDQNVKDGSYTAILDACKAILGTGGRVMTDICYAPYHLLPGPVARPAVVKPSGQPGIDWTDDGTDDYSTYDAIKSAMDSRGLVWVPNLHTLAGPNFPGTTSFAVKAGSGYTSLFWPIGLGTYQVANSDYNDYAAVALAIGMRYSATGPQAGSYPIDSMELWCEPNTSTGNMAGQMTATIIAHLMSKTANGLRNSRSHSPAGPGLTNVIGPALGSVDVAYLTSMTTALSTWADGLTHISCHLYPGQQLPNAGAGYSSWPRQPGSVTDLESYVRTNLTTGLQPKKFAVTEAAYSGTDQWFGGVTSVPNIWDAAQASAYEFGSGGMADILRGFSSPNTPVDIYMHFGAVDQMFWGAPDDHWIDQTTLTDSTPYCPPAYKEKMGLVGQSDWVNKISGDAMVAYLASYGTAWP